MPYKEPPIEHRFKKGDKRASEAGVKGGKASKRGRSLTSIMEEMLEGDLPENIRTYLEEKGVFIKSKAADKALIEASLLQAMTGNSAYFKELWNRKEGKEPDILIGDSENPLEINHTLDEKISKTIEKLKKIK